MRKILVITTNNNTLSLKEAVEKIKKQHGNLLQIRKIYLDEYEDPAVPLDDISRSIDESDIILVEIMGDVRLTRELPNLLEGKDRTVVVLVFGPTPLFNMLNMGEFRGGELIQRFHENNLNLDEYLQSNKEDILWGKMEKLLEQNALDDARRWLEAREYYRQNESENLKNLLLFLLKNYTQTSGIGELSPPIPLVWV